MAETVKATNQDFQIELKGLLLQAKAHGLKLEDNLLVFLSHQAEVNAQNHAMLREAQSKNHLTV